MPRPTAPLPLLAPLLALLLACAGELPRGEAPIRRPPITDGALPDADLDLALPDTTPDAAPPDAGPPPDRGLWLVVRHDDVTDGVRARLQPPHTPAGPDPRDALPEAALLIEWRGPTDAAPLEQAWRADRPAGVLYPLGARIADRDDPTDRRAVAVADARWLAARLPSARRPLTWGGAPLIVVDAPWDAAARDAFAAAEDAIRTLDVPITWGAVIDPASLGPEAIDPLPPGFDLAIPRCTAADFAARARARQALDEDWLPCVAPPSNPRLDRPRAPADDPHPDTLRRSLILARRIGAPAVIVDGVGGWQDDRQLDPVVGEPTGAPASLTTGRVYAGYGSDRLDAVRDLLLAPARPRAIGPLGDPPALLDLVRSAGVLVERLEQTAAGLAVRLTDATERGRYEVLLDARPFVVPPGVALRYRRTDDALAIDLVFADGSRLLDLVPDAGGARVERPLDPFVGRRVEEACLVYTGGRARLDARIEDPRIEAVGG